MSTIAHRARRTSFVGRAGEVAAIRRWYAEPGAWVLTVVGAPGAGKTRLAHEAVSRLMVAGDEIVWVELHAASPADVPSRLASAAGLSASDWPALTRALRQRADPLVLDECETAVSGVLDALMRLSEALPSLRVLATSRDLDRLIESVRRTSASDSAPWPGERMLERAKRSRVHVAISTLRTLGLREHLSRSPAGYRVDLAVRRERNPVGRCAHGATCTREACRAGS